MPTLALNNPSPQVLDGRHIRATAFAEAQEELLQHLHDGGAAPPTSQARALVIGAGYSGLPRLVSEFDYQVTAVDPSPDATAEAARRRPTVQALTAGADRLPLPDAAFDLVWCIDTLEVVDDPGAVLIEVSRVARPDGLVVLDTVSATVLSRLIYLRLFQQVPGTRIMPRDRYHRDRFLTPERLSDLAVDSGLRVEWVRGFEPASPQRLLSGLLQRRRGRIADEDLAARAGFRMSAPEHRPPVTYYALARPNGHRAPSS